MNSATRPARRGGFTIIELLIVVIVIGVLASAAIAKYQEFAEKARTRTCTSNQSQIDNALNAYFTIHRSLPSTASGCLLLRPSDGWTYVQQDVYGWGQGGQNGIIAQTMGDTKGFFCPGTLAVYFQGDRSRVTSPAGYWGKNGLGCYVHSHQGRESTTRNFVFSLNSSSNMFMPQGHSFVYCHDFGRVGDFGPDGSQATRHSARW